MSAASAPSRSVSPNISRLLGQVTNLIGKVLGVPAADLNPETTFVSLGADSLTLLQTSQSIQSTFGVKVPFRLLFDDIANCRALAEHLADKVSIRERVAGTDAAVLETSNVTGTVRPNPVKPSRATATVAVPVSSDARSSAEQIVQRQLQIMELQLAMLSGQIVEGPEPEGEDSGELEATPCDAASSACEHIEERTPVDPPDEPQTLSQKINPDHYSAYGQAIEAESNVLSDGQREFLTDLIKRVSAKTAQSKARAENYRPVLADSRGTAGFKIAWKEICYPLVAERASGSRVWDLDGNEYIDITMGFGALLFGHSPKFLTQALEDQVANGIQLGLQSKVAGEAAQLLCEMAGVDRATFCNSGTEAVMTGLRLARKATGRDRIAMFAGAYHGTFDGVLVRGEKVEGGLKAVPLAPGIPEHMVQNVTVLDYGTKRSLEILRNQAHQMAAIVVEPAQSRRPDLHPTEFLQALRKIADESGAVLIFDEVVTGFRTHPGGAQALFGVKADLIAYGKAVGGGVPVGIIAGKRGLMDAIDGGSWSFGDKSFPTEQTTFFAGTYFKHPLTMAAVHATLSHLKQQGAGLQEQLTRTTGGLVDRLNACLEELDVPVRVVTFGSLFRFVAPRRFRYWDLFYSELLDRGVYVCETRTCFLSTAHTSADLDLLVSAVRDAVVALKRVGFVSEGRPEDEGGSAGKVSRPLDKKVIALTSAQAGLLAVSALSTEFSTAYNESVVLRLAGHLNIPALARSLQALVDRHESLRTSFDVEAAQQIVWPTARLSLRETDLSQLSPQEQSTEVTRELTSEATESFDLSIAPLVRTRLIKQAEGEHVLTFTTHHLVSDGWSFGVLLDELAAIYTAEVQGIAPALAPAMQLTEFVNAMQSAQKTESFRAAERYWLSKFSGPIEPLALPTDRPRSAVQSFRGSKHQVTFDRALRARIRTFASRNGCTVFSFLLASIQSFLAELTLQDDIVIGTHSAGQSLLQPDDESNNRLVGFCLNMLPIRASFADRPGFSRHLERTCRTLAEAYKHQEYPVSQLIRQLKLVRDPARPPLISLIVNIDRIPIEGLEQSGTLLPGLQVSLVDSPVVFSRFDMLWSFLETPEELSLTCTYRVDLFDHSTVKSWISRYEQSLCQLVQDASSKGFAPVRASLAANANGGGLLMSALSELDGHE